MYHGTIGISQNHRLFRFAMLPRHCFISQIAVCFSLPEYHGIVSSLISSFISARLCITASSVLPYHRLFRFRHSITASVFISYHRISHNGGLYWLDHLSWLLSYFSLRCILISVSYSMSRKVSRLTEYRSLRRISA